VSQTVLITGAFGLVGSATVKRFAADGWRVVATAHHKAGQSLPPGVETRWVDLTDPAQVDRVVSEVSPAAIIHLAAVIPPTAYRDAKLARRVNVDATAALVRAAEAQPNTPRLVHASSGAVYGAPNPNLIDRVCANTPPQPCELYGGHKLEAEQLVRSSNLEWVVLRLGGIYSVDPSAMPFTSDLMYFSSLLPTDGRVHTVDVRDVATAFAAATTADVAGEILLIAGDDSHLLLIGQTASAAVAAQGMPGLLPVGRPGNPERDDDWYPSYWMDVTRAQQALSFPASFVAGHAGRDARHHGLETLPDAASHPGSARDPQTQSGLLQQARPVRRSLGRHTRQTGRPRAGHSRVLTHRRRTHSAPSTLVRSAALREPGGRPVRLESP
jgi:nucleoside-diphosphate-sugar epimerase